MTQARRWGTSRTYMMAGLGLTAVLIAGCTTTESSGSSSSESSPAAEDLSTDMPENEQEQELAATPSTEAELEEPPFVGNDAAFDFLMVVRDNQPDGWGLNAEELPTRLEVTGRVLPEMVNPERCANLASLVEAGYLVQEGPLQYIQDSAEGDGVDNFVVIGQAPLDALLDLTQGASECETFSISRQSSSVIDNSPTQDVMTYALSTEVVDNDYVLLTFEGDGEIQIVDENYACLREGEGFCMYPRSENGYRLIRQVGETLVVAAVTSYKDKGGSAPRPMKLATFREQSQGILDSLDGYTPQS